MTRTEAPVGTTPAAEPETAATGAAPRRRWCAGTRIAVAIGTAWLGFVGLHYLLSGNWWVWELVELLPPVGLVISPLIVLALPVVMRLFRVRLPALATGWLVAVAVAALVLGGGMAGFNLHALRGDPATAAPPDALRVVSWNAEHWDQGEDTDELYAYLQETDADVYLLQEYLHRGEVAPYPIDQMPRLQREFEGYHFAAVGQFLTISRFPIVSSEPIKVSEQDAFRASAWDDYWLIQAQRTDVRVDGETVSFYNIHIPTPVQFRYSPAHLEFYEYVREAHPWREAVFDALLGDVAENCNPIMVAGDFNASTIKRGLHELDPKLRDALPANRELYPGTFALRELDLQLWRLDYAYVTPEMEVHQYDLRHHQELSDHDSQYLVVSLDESRSAGTGSCAADGR